MYDPILILLALLVCALASLSLKQEKRIATLERKERRRARWDDMAEEYTASN